MYIHKSFIFLVVGLVLNPVVLFYSLALVLPDVQVAERFVAAIDESIKPPLQMGFFIHYNVDDILRQATESTLRYQRGST